MKFLPSAKSFITFPFRLQPELVVFLQLILLLLATSHTFSDKIVKPEVNITKKFISSVSKPKPTLKPEEPTLPTTVTFINITRPPNEEYIHKQEILIEPALNCNSDVAYRVTILAVVHSAPSNLKHRNYIRQSWGNGRWVHWLGLRPIFAIGNPNHTILQKKLALEANSYGDILQGNFIDSYRNLTLKALMWLEWVPRNCPEALFLLKTDDDMTINVFRLIPHLHRLVNYNETLRYDTIFCFVYDSRPVIRDPQYKWSMLPSEYSASKFGKHCPGFAYILTSDLLPKLYQASKITKSIWFDDIYVTGYLAQTVSETLQKLGSPENSAPNSRPLDNKRAPARNSSIGVKYHPLNDVVSDKPDRNHEEIRKGTMLIVNNEKLDTRYQLWREVLRQHTTRMLRDFL